MASQAHLDDLCPVSSRNARKLCVVLTVVDSSADQRYISTMRQFVRREGAPLAAQRIQFAYMFVDKQKEFILPFLEGLPKEEQSSQGAKRDVVVVWRLEHSRARFAWLRGVWDATETSLNASGEELKKRLDEILRGTSKLDYQAALVTLTDEFRPSLFTRISRAAMRMGETAWFHLSKEEALPVLSAVGTFLVILLIGYGLNYAAISEERTHSARQEKRKATTGNGDDQWHPEDPRTGPQRNPSARSTASIRERRIMREMTPLMHELRAETYFGMIRLLKPGCRSIVVLVDEQSKDILLPQFAKHVWPIRNNKTFSFGYLMVEKNLPWFRKLLEYTLPVENPESTDQGEGGSVEKSPAGKVAASLYERLKSINPRKTLGTVLVLCGWKLYFNMYHPMHTAARRKNFLGFDDDGEEESSSEDSDSEKATHEEVQALRKGYQLKLEDVLNGLPNWLDRLFEGSIRRYYIPEWPDNLK
ncbi:unnamed protein product [Toxocara canis]|uniref:DnaJ-like protein subfamily C member 16 n=1 Tax=Toxocara canis TaxID=6265 RepID=A0A3P7IQW7_TOXCA|nr:unnamed protein product [Toxocara canis]